LDYGPGPKNQPPLRRIRGVAITVAHVHRFWAQTGLIGKAWLPGRPYPLAALARPPDSDSSASPLLLSSAGQSGRGEGPGATFLYEFIRLVVVSRSMAFACLFFWSFAPVVSDPCRSAASQPGLFLIFAILLVHGLMKKMYLLWKHIIWLVARVSCG
jgi:hypothetical protein